MSAPRPIPSGVARAVKEHMPFAGHRNCAQWGDLTSAQRKATEYGLEPEFAKKAASR